MKKRKVLKYIIGSCVIVLVTSTIFLLFKGDGLSVPQKSFKDVEGLYHKANSLYNRGDYKEAKKLCEEVINYFDRNYIKKLSEENTEKIIFKATYFLLANIEAESEDIEEAINTMNEVINLYKDKVLSEEAAVEAQLKIGSIYLRAGDFTRAIEAFQRVIESYPQSYHTTTARDNIDEISEQKIGDICGKVLLEGRKDHSDITISIFNGFSLYSTSTKKDGSYCIPLYKSTEGTYISVFASKTGYMPQVSNIPVKQHIGVPKMTLKTISNPNLGVLVGVCYKSISGGKIRFHYGIDSYDMNLEIHIKAKGSERNVKCDGNGIYMLVLPKGSYTIATGRSYTVDDIIVEKGKTTIQNLFSGGTMID